MPRSKSKPPRAKEEHTLVVVRVESHEASLEACVNRDVYTPQYAIRLDDSEPLFEFKNRLVITGVCVAPKQRAGDLCELTLIRRRIDTMPRSSMLRPATHTVPRATASTAAGSSPYSSRRWDLGT